MRRIILLAGLLLALGVFLSASARPGAALAATPSNDTFAGAITVAGVPFSQVLDTTEATTDADDAQLNESCGAPATDASVWYAFVSSVDVRVVIDVSQSSYSAGLIVGVGSPGNLQTVTCNVNDADFFASAGTLYYVLAFDDQFDGGGNGGSLSISFHGPPTVDIAVNPTGEVNAQTGVATISGTYTCTNADFISIGGIVRQNVGRFSISGFIDFGESGMCDGAPHAWASPVSSENGKFKGGKAMATPEAFACGAGVCTEGFSVEQAIQLSGGRK